MDTYKYIVLEWIHGSGKSFVADTLTQKLWATYYHFPNEQEKLGQAIREVLTKKDLLQKWQILGSLYAAMTNKFHVETQDDGKLYILDREAVTSWLIFQKDIPWDMRKELYKYGIESLQKRGVVIYISIDKETARIRSEKRNDILAAGDDETFKNKAKDLFVLENFDRLTKEYEEDFIPQVQKLWLPCFVVDNNGTLDQTIQQILNILQAS